MKRILSLLAVLSLFAGCIKEKQEGADLKSGDRLPEFEVIMNDGTVVSDKTLGERVSVVMFFHTLELKNQ